MCACVCVYVRASWDDGKQLYNRIFINARKRLMDEFIISDAVDGLQKGNFPDDKNLKVSAANHNKG